AQTKEYEAIAEYNSTLARFEWSKGTMLEHDNVSIAEGDLPVCAQVRAVDNERMRTAALVVAERPNPDAMRHPGMLAGHDVETQSATDDFVPMPQPFNGMRKDSPKQEAPKPRIPLESSVSVPTLPPDHGPVDLRPTNSRPASEATPSPLPWRTGEPSVPALPP